MVGSDFGCILSISCFGECTKVGVELAMWRTILSVSPLFGDFMKMIGPKWLHGAFFFLTVFVLSICFSCVWSFGKFCEQNSLLAKPVGMCCGKNYVK